MIEPQRKVGVADAAAVAKNKGLGVSRRHARVAVRSKAETGIDTSLAQLFNEHRRKVHHKGKDFDDEFEALAVLSPEAIFVFLVAFAQEDLCRFLRVVIVDRVLFQQVFGCAGVLLQHGKIGEGQHRKIAGVLHADFY